MSLLLRPVAISRPLEAVDAALVAARVTHVQVTDTTMRAAAPEVQWTWPSALLDDLSLRGLFYLRRRGWTLPNRLCHFGFNAGFFRFAIVVSSVELCDPNGGCHRFHATRDRWPLGPLGGPDSCRSAMSAAIVVARYSMLVLPTHCAPSAPPDQITR